MWFLLGLASGFFNTLYVIASKKLLRNANPRVITFGAAFFAVPFFLLASLFLGWTTPSNNFWPILAFAVASNIIGNLLLMHALKIGELSLTIPFLSFTPLFLVFTSKIMVGESPSPAGLWGILAIVAGSYALQFEQNKGILGPFKSFLKNRGSQLALLVSFIYAIGSNIDKMGVTAAGPVTYSVFLYSIMGLFYLPFIARQQPGEAAGSVKKRNLSLIVISFLLTATSIAYLLALKSGIVPYVIALKRTNAFWSVLLGWIVFKERNVLGKVIGASLMIIGVLLISLN